MKKNRGFLDSKFLKICPEQVKYSFIFRVLTTPIDDLRGTDITEAALEKLSKSRIKRVSILGKLYEKKNWADFKQLFLSCFLGQNFVKFRKKYCRKVASSEGEKNCKFFHGNLIIYFK